ncbi:MAG: peptidoglycan DD-metalloendopeptidase family protein [Rhizobiaceae bacterium]
MSAPSNQQQIIGGQPKRLSSYGEEFDSGQSNIHVAKRDGVYPPQVEYGQNGRYASREVVPPSQSSTVSRSQLPPVTSVSPTLQQTAKSAPIVLQPRYQQPAPLRVQNPDTLTTSSLPATPSNRSVPAKSAGWDESKGVRVTVKPGETLYNLSRRYGVPVSAIMSANNIADGNSVEAGRKILIPTYNYSSAAPVSAPDSDPITKASRASRGFQGQVRGRIAVPTQRVAVNTTQVATTAAPAARVTSTPISHYVVKSGDTLSGIAYRTGASMAAIRNSNSMTDNTVRLGQKLIIPGSGSSGTGRVDSTSTGSIPAASSTKKRAKPVRTASNEAVGSISPAKKKSQKSALQQTVSFRWPAEGRVISKFGQRSASGVNDGIDISMPVGTPVKASQSGTVIYAGSELEDFGNLILVSHSGGWVSAYAHSSANLVARGEKVKRGQTIAKSGRTGNANVPKLHFELRKNSNPVNPLNHLAR